jgi:hypothetical protein
MGAILWSAISPDANPVAVVKTGNYILAESNGAIVASSFASRQNSTLSCVSLSLSV